MHGIACDPDDNEAFRWLRKAVELDDKQSTYPLGMLYESGRGGIQDAVRAVAHYRNGAEARDLDAIEALARCADEGIGMSKNPAEAARLYQLAADDDVAFNYRSRPARGD